jgi:peptidylprolyl isomerase
MAQPAAQGDTVKVHYTGTLDDGTVFDSSRQRGPLEFTIGQGQILPKFEQAVTGLEPGQTTETRIEAAEAYGQRQEDRIVEFPREKLPEGLEPEVGQKLQMQTESGQTTVVTVTDKAEQTITLDANHPLAGQDLSFEIELVEIA